MDLLALDANELDAVRKAPTLPEAEKLLVAFKAKIKKHFRRAAMNLHPDRTDNDPAKTEDFKLISAVMEELEKVTINQRPAPQPQTIVVDVGGVRIHFKTTGNTATSTTTVSGRGYWSAWGF